MFTDSVKRAMVPLGAATLLLGPYATVASAQAPCEQAKLRADVRSASQAAVPVEEKLATLDLEESDKGELSALSKEVALLTAKLTPVLTINTERGSPICDRDGKDLKRDVSKQLQQLNRHLAQLRARIRAMGEEESQAEVVLLWDFQGTASDADIKGILLDGKPFDKDKVKLQPGEHFVTITHSPSGPLRNVKLDLEVGKVKMRPQGASVSEKKFSFVLDEGSAAKLAFTLNVEEVPDAMFVETVLEPKDADVVIKLNESRVEPGATSELDAGKQNKLVVTHPSTTESRWFHVSAALDGERFVPSKAEKDSKLFEFDGRSGRTRELKLAYQTGAYPHPLRSTLVWGGLALGVVGGTVGLVTQVVSNDCERDARRVFNRNACANGACSDEIEAEVNTLYDDADANNLYSVVGYVAGGVGIGTMIVALVALEGGDNPPDGLVAKQSASSNSIASVDFIPSFGPAGYSANFVGTW
jgi:hypothetical protein